MPIRSCMNFNTANSTFRQLMSNGLSYRVPSFQRDYSWSADEWDDLWQDLDALVGEDPEPAHYMGYLVLRSEDARAFEVIDGQQRMTTLSLLMLAAIARLTALAAPGDPGDPQLRRAEQLRGNYIGYLDPVSLVPRSKLVLNRHDDSFYQHYLVPLERLPQRGLNASEHLLRGAFTWFRERLGDRLGNDGEAVARFVDTVVDKLFFTVITVTDQLNAFTVFETLNARGVRLSATDLLKNHLFSLVSEGGAHESEIRVLESRWEGVIGRLGSESFPEFLRTFWNSRHRLVRKSELFKTVRREVGGRGGAFGLIRDMDRHARVYAAMRSPEEGGWPAQERDALAQLQTFDVRQPLAVLLAAFERFEQEDRPGFGRFLRAVAVLSFRYNVICGRRSNEQETLYNELARDLSAGRVGGAADAIRALRPVYPADGEFRTAFAAKALRTTSSRNRRVVRFILFRIEEHLSGRGLDFESTRYGVEHVLPENPGADWEQFDERQREEFTYRLGNMTLLETVANRDLGNTGFDVKRSRFRESGLQATAKLGEDYDTWNVETIRERQTWMARQATSIWRIGF